MMTDWESTQAAEVRRQWMRLLGCDEAEIREACDRSVDLFLKDELDQLAAAIRIAERNRRRAS